MSLRKIVVVAGLFILSSCCVGAFTHGSFSQPDIGYNMPEVLKAIPTMDIPAELPLPVQVVHNTPNHVLRPLSMRNYFPGYMRIV